MYGKDLKLKDVLSYVKTHKFVAENCHIKKNSANIFGKGSPLKVLFKNAAKEPRRLVKLLPYSQPSRIFFMLLPKWAPTNQPFKGI